MEQIICGIHNTPMVLKPAGISKSGKPYPAFWSCPVKSPDGQYCSFKPNVAPTPTNNFTASLDKDNKDDQIAWLNAKNCAAQIIKGTPWNVERFRILVEEIYNVKNGG